MVSVAAAAIAAPADASTNFDIPAGPLATTVLAIGGAAGVTIGLTDKTLARLPMPPLRGRLGVAAALRRLLAHTEATFVAIDPQTFQIARRARRAAPSTGAASPAPPDSLIVVTGSKQRTRLADYAGTAVVIDAGGIAPDSLLHGSDALVDRLPILASTHLGPGRDKLFIRGLADSSFAGPTRATVGEYLGEVRLNFSAPDPDLALYDVHSVEVLEGPQGTLYGAGPLGGIVRLEPEPPDVRATMVELAAGGSFTAHGGAGGDGAVVVNLPISAKRAALRVVGYAATDGGYIDDPSRGLSDVNRTVTRGARATLRLFLANDWTVDLGGVVQDINSRDGQYSERGLAPLTRGSVIAQPFDNDYSLASVVLRHDAGATSFVSATAYVAHDVSSSFDATRNAAAPQRYESAEAISIIENETRLSHRTAHGGSWVVGVQFLRNVDRLSRTLGPIGTATAISGTRNMVEEASLYGEATIPLRPRLFVTGGGRVSYTRQTSEERGTGEQANEPSRDNASLLPSAGLLWKPLPPLAVYARYQEGYRPGGLSVQGNSTQRFEADSLGMWETGFRYTGRDDGFSLSAAASFSRWEDIQADLVDAAGLPYTANVGSGRVLGLEVQGAWRIGPGFTVAGGLFANSSRLDRPAPGYGGESDPTLPNIPPIVARGNARYSTTIAGRPLTLRGSLGYVGRSRLGVGPLLDIHQGGYMTSSAGLDVAIGRSTLSLDASNLADRRGNVFALGNPFEVMLGRQETPLRPTTVRLGVTARF